MPKYYRSCKLQGNEEKNCYVLHPKLYPNQEKEDEGKKNKDDTTATGDKAKEGDFQEQRFSGGGGKGNQNRRGFQKWNARGEIQEGENIINNNKSSVLDKEGEEQQKGET